MADDRYWHKAGVPALGVDVCFRIEKQTFGRTQRAIEPLVGKNKMAFFIREAVKRELKRREGLKQRKG